MFYKFSKSYFLLQQYVRIFFRLHFRRLKYISKENIPTDKPIIFAPTHRNALIDALILTHDHVKRQIVFLARADIFKAGLLSKIFNMMRIMPVYRIRDGKDNLSKNEDIFKQSGDVLKGGSPLCLFPEAIHNPNQNLLPLKKGIPRIALPMEATLDFQLDTHIVPVAFYYTGTDRFLSDVYVTYGKPIAISKYKAIYETNENLAINQLRKEMESELRQYVVDIPTEDYDVIAAMVKANENEVLRLSQASERIHLPEAAQRVIRHMQTLKEQTPSSYQEKIEKIKQSISSLQKTKLAPADLVYKNKAATGLILQFILLITAAPLAFVGMLNSILPILGYNKLLKVIRDKQFISSIRLISGMFVAPLFYLLQAAVVWIVCSGNIALLYLIASPILFYFASYWRKWWKESQKAWRIKQLKKSDGWSEIEQAFSI